MHTHAIIIIITTVGRCTWDGGGTGHTLGRMWVEVSGAACLDDARGQAVHTNSQGQQLLRSHLCECQQSGFACRMGATKQSREGQGDHGLEKGALK